MGRAKRGINIIPKNREHAEYLEWLQRQRELDRKVVRRLYVPGKQLCKTGVTVDNEYVFVLVYVNKRGEISYHTGIESDKK